MQIQYNITRIEGEQHALLVVPRFIPLTKCTEWCKAHDMPEGLLQLEHLMQATKLLQLKKVSSDISACFTDVLGDHG